MLWVNRAALIAEAWRVLQPGRVLSMLPFHMDGGQKEALVNGGL